MTRTTKLLMTDHDLVTDLQTQAIYTNTIGNVLGVTPSKRAQTLSKWLESFYAQTELLPEAFLKPRYLCIQQHKK